MPSNPKSFPIQELKLDSLDAADNIKLQQFLRQIQEYFRRNNDDVESLETRVTALEP